MAGAGKGGRKGGGTKGSFEILTRSGKQSVSGEIIGSLGIHKSGSQYVVTDTQTGRAAAFTPTKSKAIAIANKVFQSDTPTRSGTSKDDFWLRNVAQAVRDVG